MPLLHDPELKLCSMTQTYDLLFRAVHTDDNKENAAIALWVTLSNIEGIEVRSHKAHWKMEQTKNIPVKVLFYILPKDVNSKTLERHISNYLNTKFSV